MYLLAFSVGLPSNLLAVWVLVFRTKHLPSTTMLINLTVVDCLLFLVLPFQIVYHFQGNNWDLGEPFCRIVMAMFYGNIYGLVPSPCGSGQICGFGSPMFTHVVQRLCTAGR
ncbi:hypothetical protein GOODEAATRI_034114 [Goodea atripinnis]|uniref:G-protein coupled receptors family 1 profile domain-containing protein n=1 Tax=Goodea atripinnis TaxID=208336 RepID=A0ABV0PJI3_9TELE